MLQQLYLFANFTTLTKDSMKKINFQNLKLCFLWIKFQKYGNCFLSCKSTRITLLKIQIKQNTYRKQEIVPRNLLNNKFQERKKKNQK